MNYNLETLLQSLPSREDLAGAIGLESRHSTSSELLPALSLFGTGMLIGAGLALLFAPKSGTETRRDISDAMQQYGYGHGEEGSSSRERQMASQTSYQASTPGQEKPRQMSGQTATEQSRQMAGQSHTTAQSKQMGGQGSEHRSESELSRTSTPGTGSRNI